MIRRGILLGLLMGFFSLSGPQRMQRSVIVVGSGLAGLSAAIQAYQAGAQVTILEKESKGGGNSMKASSGMNAVYTPSQEREKITDTADLFAQDTLKSGKGLSDETLVSVLTQQARAAWDFLRSFGVKLDVLCQSGGHSRARTHRTDSDQQAKVSCVGRDIMSALAGYIDNLHDPRLRLLTDARVCALLRNSDGRVTGLQYILEGKKQELFADAVILATGGFCGDVSPDGMLARYVPQVAHLSTTNGTFANGDGIMLAQEAGAQLVDMAQIQIHPTGFVDPKNPLNPRKILAPESLRAVGGILLDGQGKRFCNELAPRDAVTAAIMKSCAPYPGVSGGPVTAYLILTADGVRLFGQKILSFYEKMGLIQHVSNARALGALLALESDVIAQTLRDYEQGARSGHDVFGKTVFATHFTSDQPLWVMRITPCLHYCMGGVRFDAQARVLGGSGPIKGLFAAGEVTGGLHGANRLCGNSLLECVVFGRIAGQNAALGLPA